MQWLKKDWLEQVFLSPVQTVRLSTSDFPCRACWPNLFWTVCTSHDVFPVRSCFRSLNFKAGMAAFEKAKPDGKDLSSFARLLYGLTKKGLSKASCWPNFAVCTSHHVFFWWRVHTVMFSLVGLTQKLTFSFWEGKTWRVKLVEFCHTHGQIFLDGKNATRKTWSSVKGFKEYNDGCLTWPHAMPIPRSPIPWGQDKFSSNASEPAAWNDEVFYHEQFDRTSEIDGIIIVSRLSNKTFFGKTSNKASTKWSENAAYCVQNKLERTDNQLYRIRFDESE